MALFASLNYFLKWVFLQCAYCKDAVREGSFRGSIVFILKEQREQRALRAAKEGRRVNVLMVGGKSGKVERIGREIVKKREMAVEGVEFVQVKGLLDRRELYQVFKELGGLSGKLDKICGGRSWKLPFQAWGKRNQGLLS